MASVSVTRAAAGTASIVIDTAMQRSVRTLSNATERACDQTIKSRTGRLRSSVRVDPATKMGPRMMRGGVSATAPYAGHVHDGTGLYADRDYIRGNPNLKWTNAGGPYSGTWIGLAVRGQPAQNFLTRAYNIARLSVGYFQPIKGFDIPAPQTAPPYSDRVQRVRRID